MFKVGGVGRAADAATASATTSPPGSKITTRTSGPAAARSNSNRPTTRLFIRAHRRLHQGQVEPAQRPPADPGPAVGRAGARQTSTTRAPGSSIPKQDIEAGGLSMTVNAELTDHLTLRSISAWRKDRQRSRRSTSTRSPRSMSTCPRSTATSRSARNSSCSIESDKLHGLVGFYYLDAKARHGFDVLLLDHRARRLDAYTAGDVDTETWSIFGDFTYDFTPSAQPVGRRPLHLGQAQVASSSRPAISAA